MKVLVIGGMHGNEPLGLEVIKLFQETPVINVEVVIANEQAVSASCRFTARDLNRSFPGNTNSKDYESRRAAILLSLTKKFDIVLDFHNTYCQDNDCGFVGDDAGQELYDAAWLLGLTKIVVADYDCVNKYATNCLSVEISLSSKLNKADLWYEKIKMLSKLERVSVKPKTERYRFVYRMTTEDSKKFDLPSYSLKAFKEMPASLSKQLGVVGPAYPIFIDDKFTPYNYGGVLSKI